MHATRVSWLIGLSADCLDLSPLRWVKKMWGTICDFNSGLHLGRNWKDSWVPAVKHATQHFEHRVKLDPASICNPWLPCVWLCEVGWKRPGHFMSLQGFGASCCRCRDRGLLLDHTWVVFAFFNCFLQVLWLWTLLTSLRRHSYETCPGMVTPGIDRTHIYLAKCFHRLGREKA